MIDSTLSVAMDGENLTTWRLLILGNCSNFNIPSRNRNSEFYNPTAFMRMITLIERFLAAKLTPDESDSFQSFRTFIIPVYLQIEFFEWFRQIFIGIGCVFLLKPKNRAGWRC